MKITKTLRDLCTPATLYLIISVITILFSLFSGVKIIGIAMKGVFAIFWTFILNLLCQNGYKSVSWFLVLFPYVVMAGAFAITFLKIKEGLETMGVNPEDAAKVAGGTIGGKVMRASPAAKKKMDEMRKAKTEKKAPPASQ